MSVKMSSYFGGLQKGKTQVSVLAKTKIFIKLVASDTQKTDQRIDTLVFLPGKS